MDAKSERLDLRLTAAQKQLIAQAALESGSTVSSFALSSLLKAANKVVAQSQVLLLGDADFEAFISALDQPNGERWDALMARKPSWEE
ncbi:MAG: DUF1778 domain-containing protein, partial [Propionibacteriaceae bacterium]|jgi:uncharacterized protein (DUF1778 family)|nr:DUF1778 domain-containing protein [Propionibacteriaceae bacterium]